MPALLSGEMTARTGRDPGMLYRDLTRDLGDMTADRVEAAHRGRIAIRRVRAGLQLFKPVASDDAYQGLVDELKWISDLFGHARDLDVFQEEMRKSCGIWLSSSAPCQK